MLTFTALGPTSVRLSGGSRDVTVYGTKAEQPGDILVQSIPEEVPPQGVVCWPGEYDIDGVTLRGIGHDEGRQTSFLIVVDGIRCAFPSPPLKEWTDAELQQVGDVDVLVIPASDTKIVQTLVDELDPRVLILLPGEGSVHAELLRTLGAQDKAPVVEHKVKGLPQEGREVVVLGK